jgi:hypothetical protein
LRTFGSATGGGHGGKAHDGKARSALIQFVDQDERLCSLLDDPRILEIAGEFCSNLRTF